MQTTLKKPRPDYGIARRDYPKKSTHGYYVRLCGESKFFSDNVYGSKRLAREQAENYRDQIWRTMSPAEQRRGAA